MCWLHSIGSCFSFGSIPLASGFQWAPFPRSHLLVPGPPLTPGAPLAPLRWLRTLGFPAAVQKVPTSNTEGGWSFSLAEYVRHNDMPIYEASDRVLRTFQDELMPAESFSEFLDVVGQWSH